MGDDYKKIKKSFDWKFYVSYYSDLSYVIDKNTAWKHFKTHGYYEGRHYNKEKFENEITNTKFDWEFYISHYKDINHVTSKYVAWEHYKNYGSKEGRHANKESYKTYTEQHNKKQFFIIGCIRSGTTFLCDIFNDFVPKIFNETGERDINLRYELLKNDNFAFKFCEDFENVYDIKLLFKQSKIFLIIRDMRDVVNSIYLPNTKSIPYRNFQAVNDLVETKNISRFEASLQIVYNYYYNINNCLEKYNNLIDEIVIYEDLIYNPDNLKNLFNKYFDDKKDIEYYKSKVIKTPNQLSYLNWSNDQKKMFKTYENGFLNKTLIHYKYVKCEDW